MLSLYSRAASAAFALAQPWLRRKYSEGFDERCGIYAPEKCLENAVWVHAVSVGEVQAAMPFLAEAKNDPFSAHYGVNFLLSTTTATGAEFAERLGVQYDARLYYPWDVRRFIAAALDSLKPRAYVSAETEVWPVMLDELRRRGIPSFLINGRISDRSYRRMSRTPSFWRGVFSCFTYIMVRGEQDAERLRSLGVQPEMIGVTGDSKIDAMLMRRELCDLPRDAFPRPKLSPVFIAGSTHPGEEEAVISALQIVRKKIPDARLIIVPRHVERADELCISVSEYGKTVLYSEFKDYGFMGRDKKWKFLIVDKIGALFCLYGAAEGAFIGGSLVPRGGQNLMEPALFGVPVCHGGDMSDFRAAADQFAALGISKTVSTPEEIADFWLQSLDDDFRARAGAAAADWFAARGGAAARCWDIIKPLLGFPPYEPPEDIFAIPI